MKLQNNEHVCRNRDDKRMRRETEKAKEQKLKRKTSESVYMKNRRLNETPEQRTRRQKEKKRVRIILKTEVEKSVKGTNIRLTFHAFPSEQASRTLQMKIIYLRI